MNDRDLSFYLALKYPMRVCWVDDAWVCYFEDFPGISGHDDTFVHVAVVDALVAKGVYIEALFKRGEKIPLPNDYGKPKVIERFNVPSDQVEVPLYWECPECKTQHGIAGVHKYDTINEGARIPCCVCDFEGYLTFDELACLPNGPKKKTKLRLATKEDFQ